MKKPNAIPGGGAMPLDRKKNKASSIAQSKGQDLMRGEHVVASRTTWVAGNRAPEDLDDTSRKILAAGGQGQESSGTSIFDPVLCELAYRWFCPAGGRILDPFAGGSVRGIVAAKCGFEYHGVDLRPEQILENELQAEIICTDGKKPVWSVGDSNNIASIVSGKFDFVFSCPPYGDLETYSEDAADLSTMAHADFVKAYRHIISESVAMLAPNRFACFVVGDFRDEKGFYRNFVSDTIAAFQEAGAILYNEAILVTAIGSLPIRVGRQFESGRKLGKTHQNVLVFFKGDPKTVKDWPLPEFETIEDQGESQSPSEAQENFE